MSSNQDFLTQKMTFNVDYTGGVEEGEVSWDGDAGTIQIGLPGGEVVLQVGQEMHLPTRPKNIEGVEIKNGELVYVFDAVSAVPQVKLSDAANFPTAKGTIAMATEDVPNNNRGYFTTFGSVKDVNTAPYLEGTTLYLDTIAGQYTNIRPTPPNASVEIGIVTRQHATEGEIFVTIDFEMSQYIADVTKEPTGFNEPENVIINYDNVTRKVTLTGSVIPYYLGVPFTDIGSGYVSPAHVDVDGVYFLTYNGTDIDWRIPPNIVFSDLLIAFAAYKPGFKFAIRECHSFMPWPTHRQLHDVIGTFNNSGGDIGDYVLASTTLTDRRPSVTATTLRDEDLETILPLIPSDGNYTQLFLSGTNTVNTLTGPSDIVPLSINQPHYNEWTGAAWVQTLMSTGYRMSIWLLAIPVTSDADSQEYRYVWIQGQEQNSSFSTEQSRNTGDVSLGELSGLIPEFVFIGRVIIRYLGGNWTYEYVEKITGSKINQSTGAAGGLSIVTAEAPLLGEGTVSVPLTLDQTIIPIEYIDDHTLALTDIYETLEFTVTSKDLEFPQDSDVAIPIGSWGIFRSKGAITPTTITKGTNTVFDSIFGDVNLKLVGSDGFFGTWEKIAVDTFLIGGHVEEA